MKRNWKRLQSASLREAFRHLKDHGIAEKRLSVERQAELLGKSPDWLYKCLADASMPANLIPAYESINGADFVSRYLAVSAGKLVIEASIGRLCDATDMQTLQEIINTAVGKLLAFHAGRAGSEETVEAITDAMAKLAWHRQNVIKQAGQPDLDLGGAGA